MLHFSVIELHLNRKALNKDQFSALPQISNSEDTISIVTVFTIYNTSAGEKSSKLVTVGETSYTKMERSLAILDVFIDFIKAFLEMKLEENSWKQEYNHHYIFREQPLNSGFIAVRGTHDGVLWTKVFLKKVLEIYSSKYMEASRMLGDQKASAWIVISHPSFDAKIFTRPQPFMDEIHGASVLFLPCANYNWTPPEGAGQFHGMPLNIKVVHFKGSRKRLMLESWNFYNSSPSPSIPDMLCLILMSGRTKYF
ncbi:hypothetical protein MKX01_040881 [Papaver californicum]|nr:hypothetical protein MKX01_040881 [Papaver californicum]